MSKITGHYNVDLGFGMTQIEVGQIASCVNDVLKISSVDDVRKLVSLHQDEGQKDGKKLRGYALRNKLEGKPVYPYAFLDFLLKHKELIPEEWESKTIFFFGTICRCGRESIDTYCLRWYDGRWYRDDRGLHKDWGENDFVACGTMTTWLDNEGSKKKKELERHLIEDGLFIHKIDLDEIAKPTGCRIFYPADDEYQIKSRATGVLEIKSVDDVRKLVHLQTIRSRERFVLYEKVKESLTKKKVYSAALLDFLLMYPEFIPNAWKKFDAVYFWGTIYYNPCSGKLCVRFLIWYDDEWDWCESYLEDETEDIAPAACRAEAS